MVLAIIIMIMMFYEDNGTLCVLSNETPDSRDGKANEKTIKK